MLAIPSPDLLVSLFASAAQVLGLLAVLFGGASVARSRSGQAMGASMRPAASVWPFRLVLGGLVAVSVGFLLYHFDAVDARNRRLQANLVRSSKEQGKAVGDASLKTRSFDEQEQHARGITTDQVAAWLAEGKPLNLIDVREDEEVEFGGIAGSWHKRYPDLLAEPTNLEIPGKVTILLCESGNRSSELCDEFTKQHRETMFMRGGYEKWLAERRPLLGVGADERSDIRAIADYPNKDRLLDTDEVTRLFTEENALFVDVRYPGDFALGSLPGAVDIPLRKMLSREIEPALRQLPKRPIVAPCYDKRSSFYALVLGLKLHRLGYDYRGRYSVPHEFSLPGRESVWLARWRADHENRTLFSLIEDPLAALLLRLHAKWGNFVLAILAVVVLLRLLLAPLAFLAERDADAQHRLGPELRGLRERFAADPVRMRRATLELLRRERIGPVRNLLGAVGQIVLFLALFGAVGTAAKQVSATALGFELGAPDATGFFPLLSTLAVATLVVQQSRTRSRKTLVIAALAAALTFALVLRIPVATHLYLLANIAWAMLLSVLTRRWLARRGAPATPLPAPAIPGALTPLARAENAELLGTKAARLARMKNAGLPVPDGFVVRGDVTPDEAALQKALEGLAAPAFAVRSSASCEDGSAKSFAGVFESHLEVPAGSVGSAITAVRGSFRSPKALALGADATTGGGIVVQTMVPAEFAGVLFTEDPASAGCQRVEFVAGLGEALVSGKAKPHSHCFTRTTRRSLGQEQPPLDLQPLLHLGERIEGLFGTPQDVEWAYANGHFAILQARDITTRRGLGTHAEDAIANERRRLLALAGDAGPDEVVFCEDQITELLPEPTTFSAAFFESLWAPGGSVDLACRELGIPYQVSENGPPLTTTVFGRTYQNAREARRRVAKGVGALASFRLARSAPALESEIRGERIPAIERETKLREALDLARMPTTDLHDLLDRWSSGFVTGTYAHVEIVNLAADVCWKSATKRLARKGYDPVALLGAGPESVLHRAFTALGEAGLDLEDKVARFDAAVGFRAPHDFELAEPRYRENRELVARLAATAERAPTKAHATAVTTPKLSRMLQLEVDLARRFQDLKESAKHAAMREIATLRTLLLELGRRHGLGERIFWLEPGEVAALREPSRVPSLQALAERRATTHVQLLAVAVPTRITFADLEVLGLPATVGTHRSAAGMGGVRGTRVAGDKVATGRVRILRDPSAIETLRPGDILVAKHTDPCWTPAFGIVAGLVTEAGGWLSHAAILARESNLPAIVGAEGALERLRDGQLVSLDHDGAVVPFAERRAGERVPAAGTLQCSLGTGSFAVQVVDVGAGGLQVTSTTLQAGPGTRLAIGLGGERHDVEVAWVVQGRFGLRFQRALSASELRDLLAA